MGSAVAHTELLARSPEQGAVLDAAPKTIRLTFTEELGGGSLAVATSGRSVAAGPARVDAAEIVLDVAAGSPAGVWTVAYRVVSADGHPITGQYQFTVKPGSAKPTPNRSETPSSTPSPTASNTPTSTAPPAGAHTGRAHESPAVEVAVTVIALVALVVGVFFRRRRP